MKGAKPRVDAASRFIHASPRVIYQALVDPDALTRWLPPQGMTGRILAFEPRAGGTYRMILTHGQADHAVPGKTSEHSDVVEGRFLELVPDERIVQLVTFESDDPAYAGEMEMTWSLVAADGSTRVTITCRNVPEGIRPEDHAAGLESSLENLAAFTE